MKSLSLLILIAAFTLSNLSYAQKVDPREWHEHCEMTIHMLPIKARLLAKEAKDLNVSTGKILCKTTQSYDFSGNPHTNVQVLIEVKSALRPALKTNGFHAQETLQGHIPEQEACRGARTLANRTFKATVKREFIVQEWATPKNKDLHYSEEILFTLDNGVRLYSKQLHREKGKYCAVKPVL